MVQNVGTVDRIVRVVAGIAIGALGLVFRSWLGLIGLVLLATAGLSLCPIYLALGISTKKKAASTN